MKIRIEFKLQDMWIGVFWKKDYTIEQYAHLPEGCKYVSRNLDVWICLIPCFPIHIIWHNRK